MSDRALRDKLLRLAAEEPDFAEEIKAILAMNDGEDEDEDSDDEDMDDDHLAVKIRKKRRGPGVAKKRRKDRLRKKKKRRSPGYRNRQKRLRKRRRNKPKKFKNRYAANIRALVKQAQKVAESHEEFDSYGVSMDTRNLLMEVAHVLSDNAVGDFERTFGRASAQLRKVAASLM